MVTFFLCAMLFQYRELIFWRCVNVHFVRMHLKIKLLYCTVGRVKQFKSALFLDVVDVAGNLIFVKL